jgi:poly-gamma-glutamate synthesis protein (capsule biosynthesis protein)
MNIDIKAQLMNFKTIVILLFCFIAVKAQSQSDTTQVTFTFIGDVMGHDSQINAAYQKKSNTYDYSSYFKHLKPFTSEADFTVANLEVTLGMTPYKGYPQFSSPPALASALKDAGIDALVTSNNHSCDRGKEGIIKTIDILDSLEIPHTGTYKNIDDRSNNSPMIFEKNGIRVAIINYTYGTNGLPAPTPTIVDRIDKELIAKDIKRAQKSYVDQIIVFAHWGLEYQSNRSDQQIDLYKFCIESGADIVIGSHPHVIQRIEKHKDSFIAYSLGNFVSNQRKQKTDGGMMVNMTLSKSDKSTWVSDASYTLTWVYTPFENGRKAFYILPAAQFEKNMDFFTSIEDYEAMKLFIDDSRTLLGAQNVNVSERK